MELFASLSGTAALDAGDLDLRQLLAVADALAVAGLVLVLVDLDLRALDLAEDLTGNRNRGKRRGVGRHALTVDEQNGRQSNGVACGNIELLNRHDVADSDLVLLAAGLDDGVHREFTPVEQLSRSRWPVVRAKSQGHAITAHQPACGPLYRLRHIDPQEQSGYPSAAAGSADTPAGGPAGRLAARRRRGRGVTTVTCSGAASTAANSANSAASAASSAPSMASSAAVSATVCSAGATSLATSSWCVVALAIAAIASAAVRRCSEANANDCASGWPSGLLLRMRLLRAGRSS